MSTLETNNSDQSLEKNEAFTSIQESLPTLKCKNEEQSSRELKAKTGTLAGSMTTLETNYPDQPLEKHEAFTSIQESLPTLKRKNEEQSSLELKTQTGTLGKVVASHYNSIEEKGLSARNLSRIVYMRNFNNWVKSILISKFIDRSREETPDDHAIVALDIGCGKGGDLMKWEKGLIRHLICVDIAKTSVTQCRERYESMKQRRKLFSAEFIAADCTKAKLTSLFKNSGLKIDIASCQFAFHYCFESLAQAERMIENATQNLRKGGYFLATMPDAYGILRSIEKEGTNNSIDGDVFRIEFNANAKTGPLFGHKYNFYLEGSVDCPEFMVHFPTLVRLCKKHNLELVYEKAFDQVFIEESTDRDARNLLFKMRALEAYPTFEHEKWNKDPSDYIHIQEHFKNSSEENREPVNTLSTPEWKAICIYKAFAFKKIV